MRLPSAELLGAFYGLSELALGVLKRSGGATRPADRGSLRLLWVVILGSVAGSVAASILAPWARSPVLARCYSAGVVLFVAGIALRWWAILHLGRFFTVDVAIAADHRVVMDGPYRWVRHPSYTGAMLAFVGFGVCLTNWLSLVVVTVPIAWAFSRRIEIEEAALLAALGEDYRAYTSRTRRLIPFVY